MANFQQSIANMCVCVVPLAAVGQDVAVIFAVGAVVHMDNFHGIYEVRLAVCLLCSLCRSGCIDIDQTIVCTDPRYAPRDPSSMSKEGFFFANIWSR